jgi:hypothetical protein
MLSENEIEAVKAIVQGAFTPLRCVAEVFDYDQKLRFRVFNEKENGVLRTEEPSLILQAPLNKSKLRDVLTFAREQIVAKGHRLDPWELK